MAFSFEGREAILCLGDSITEQGWGKKGGLGWLQQLADAYGRRADVLNRGFGGYTTRTLLPIALPLLASRATSQPPYLLVTVFLGANDANSQAEQHVPIEEYRARLCGLLAAAARVARCVVCIGPGPVDNRRWPTRSNAAVAAYNDAAFAASASAREAVPGTPILFSSLLAEATGTPSGPSHARVVEGSDIPPTNKLPVPWLDFLSDGLHLSSNGNAALASLLLRVLQEQCPSVAPAALPWDFPPWNQIPVDERDAASASFTQEALLAFRKAP
jgi:lysophospholipase L1-like esterase